MLLKVGRHIRPRPHFKLIVAREEGEGRFLQGYKNRFVHLFPVSHSGPLTLVDGEVSDEDLELAGRIVARYSQGRDAERVAVKAVTPAGERTLEVVPLRPHEIPSQWVL